MRSAALAMLVPLPMMTGDLPPNSKVTGTKFSDAAFMMSLPTLVAPVKTKWFQACLENSAETSGPPSTTDNSSGLKNSATACCSNSAVRGAISDGFKTARLPAAKTLDNGDNRVNKGAFHVPIMPTTPLGWYFTQAVAPKLSKGCTLGRIWSCVQASKWSLACLREPNEPATSFIMEKTGDLPPKSASMAAQNGSQCFTSMSMARCNRSFLVAALTGPSDLKAACCSATNSGSD